MRLFFSALRTMRNYIPSDNREEAGTRIHVGSSSKFKEGKITVVDVDGDSVIMTRHEGNVCAVRNQCAHWSVALDAGQVSDGVITCPLHNSKFDLCTGENKDWVPGVAGIRVPRWTSELIALGQEPRGIRAYTVIEEDDKVYVEV